MSITTNSEASVQSRERLLQQELLRSRELGPRRIWHLSNWRAAARHRRAEPALLGPHFRFRRVLHWSTASSAFPGSKRRSPALPVLIGLFWVSGLYSSHGLPPASVCGRVSSARSPSSARSSWSPGDPSTGTVWIAAACQGTLVFLLGYYAEALTRHALIRRKLWGAADGLRRQRRSDRSKPASCFPQFPSLAFVPVGREDPEGLDGAEIEFIVVATKRDFAPHVECGQSLSPIRRVFCCLQNAGARPAGDFSRPARISLAAGRDINAPQNRLMKRAIDLAIGVPAMLVALAADRRARRF